MRAAASNKRETQERLSAPTRVRAVPPPGSLSAMHGALEQGLNPTEVYLLVSQLAPTPARRESVGADEATRRAARRRASGALPLLTPSDAAQRIQARRRGMAVRQRLVEFRAARVAQAHVRGFLARQLTWARRSEWSASQRLAAHSAGVSPHLHQLRGKWADKHAVRHLPAQRPKGPPVSPRGRPAHERLHHLGSEKLRRQSNGPPAQMEALPAPPGHAAKFQHVQPRVDTRWAAIPALPPSAADAADAPQSPVDVSEGAAHQAEASPPPRLWIDKGVGSEP